MAWLSNIVFYNLFRFEKQTQKFFTYPVLLFLKNKKVKESYKKRGVSNPGAFYCIVLSVDFWSS